MLYRNFFMWFLLIAHITLSAQVGKLLIVGGGTEYNTTENSWNAKAYQWAVDQSSTKKVAILHYADDSPWLEDYFVNDCGASEAKSLVIGAIQANDSVFLTQLAGYDVFFFRGGDQSEYYQAYKNSTFATFIQEKYEMGAVLAGTSAGLAILSSVVYTAENGSAYTDYSIHNIHHSTHTLKNDLFDLKAGYLFDSHFTDRGRMGRLVAFMAKWKNDTGQDLIGIGVDENMALAIDQNNLATAFGAGTVNLYRRISSDNYGAGPLLKVRNIELCQLLHENTIDLNNWQINMSGEEFQETNDVRFPQNKLFISGSESLNDATEEMLAHFVDAESLNNNILIVYSGNISEAETIKSFLISKGAPKVSLIEGNYTDALNSSLTPLVEEAGKLLFINNDVTYLNLFFYAGINGQLVHQLLQTDAVTLAFLGGDARLAGVDFVENYLEPNAARSNSLVVTAGLGILPGLDIIPNTLFIDPDANSDSDVWATTFSALSYAMSKSGSHQGIWLMEDNYIEIFPESDKVILLTKGTTPVIYQKWTGEYTAVASQTLRGTSTEAPRQVAGFDQLMLSFLTENDTIVLGPKKNTNSLKPIINELSIAPNPSDGNVYIQWPDHEFDITIYAPDGKIVFKRNNNEGSAYIDFSSINETYYLIECLDKLDGERILSKHIKLNRP